MGPGLCGGGGGGGGGSGGGGSVAHLPTQARPASPRTFPPTRPRPPACVRVVDASDLAQKQQEAWPPRPRLRPPLPRYRREHFTSSSSSSRPHAAILTPCGVESSAARSNAFCCAFAALAVKAGAAIIFSSALENGRAAAAGTAGDAAAARRASAEGVAAPLRAVVATLARTRPPERPRYGRRRPLDRARRGGGGDGKLRPMPECHQLSKVPARRGCRIGHQKSRTRRKISRIARRQHSSRRSITGSSTGAGAGAGGRERAEPPQRELELELDTPPPRYRLASALSSTA